MSTGIRHCCTQSLVTMHNAMGQAAIRTTRSEFDSGSVLMWTHLIIDCASTIVWMQEGFWQSWSCQNRFRIELSVDTALVATSCEVK